MNRLVPFAGLALLSCAHFDTVTEARPVTAARARIEPSSGTLVSGVARFETLPYRNAVALVVELNNLPPGKHAVHLHTLGDCSSPDAMSAGEHWNPGGEAHGHLEKLPHHLGDVENVEANSEGRARLEITSSEWSVGTQLWTDVVGRSIVVHERADDFHSQPGGNAGLRVACGVIEPLHAGPSVSILAASGGR